MPKGDRTGPMGCGPMTGRGAGRCAGYPVAGYMNPGPGRGCGCGMGLGRARSFGRGGAWGRPHGTGRGVFSRLAYPSPPVSGQTAPKQERAFLEEQMKALQGQLDVVKQRINELAGQEEVDAG